MADFTDLIAKFIQLDENVSITIPINTVAGDSSLSDFATADTAFFNTTHSFDSSFGSMYDTTAFNTVSTFNTASLNEDPDLSIFIDALNKTSNRQKKKVRHAPPISSGLPLQFFKETQVHPCLPLQSPETAFPFRASETTSPSLTQVLATCGPDSVIILPPGIYQSKYIISKNVTLRGEGEVIFDTQSPSFTINGGEVIFENISIRHGRIDVNSSRLQLTNCKINATINGSATSRINCQGCSFTQSEDFCVILSHSNATIDECTFANRGLMIKEKSSLTLNKSKIESITDHAITIDESLCKVTESNIGNCTQSCIYAINEADMSIFDSHIYDSDQGHLIEASDGGIVKSKNCQLSGECKCSIFSIAGASILCENLELKRKVISAQGGFIECRQCQINTVNVDNARFNAIGSDICSLSGPGIATIGQSDVLLDQTDIHNCRSNGCEFSDLTAVTATNCKFRQNSGGGVSVSSTSAMFSHCLFSSNAVVGAEIVGNAAAPVFEDSEFSENSAVEVTIFKNTEPRFTNCKFIKTERICCSVLGASPYFKGCYFKNYTEAALEIAERASPAFSGCTFEQGSGFCAQIHDDDTSASFEKCNFRDNSKASAILAFSKSIVSFESCNFSANGYCHAEARNDAHLRFDSCVLAECGSGVGMYVHTNASADFTRSTIKDIEKVGIFIGPRGKVNMNESEIYNCGEVGLASETGSSLNAVGCTFRNNGHVGIQADGGHVTVEQCLFEEHSDFGIYSTALATVKQVENKFIDNAKGDTQIA